MNHTQRDSCFISLFKPPRAAGSTSIFNQTPSNALYKFTGSTVTFARMHVSCTDHVHLTFYPCSLSSRPPPTVRSEAFCLLWVTCMGRWEAPFPASWSRIIFVPSALFENYSQFRAGKGSQGGSSLTPALSSLISLSLPSKPGLGSELQRARSFPSTGALILQGPYQLSCGLLEAKLPVISLNYSKAGLLCFPSGSCGSL